MPVPGPTGYALNRTRNAYLATHVRLAATHWSRFCGLMATDAARFPAGEGFGSFPATAYTPSPCASLSMCSTWIAIKSSSTSKKI